MANNIQKIPFKQENHKQIVLTSYDAGASEYLGYLVKATKETFKWNIFLLSQSPAIHIFTRLKLPYTECNNIQLLEYNITQIKPKIILYGTGWQKDFSQMVYNIVHKYPIKSIAILDHWTNYKERFSHGYIPNNIIVMDSQAYLLAKATFPTTNIIHLKNYFLLALYREFLSSQQMQASTVLFISEPTATIAYREFSDKNAYGFTEYSVVQELLEHFDTLTIRLHPADEENKYNSLLEQYHTKKVTLIYPHKESLATSLAHSRLTIGFDGMALYISYLLGIPSLSYMPKSTRQLTIPLPEQYKINTLEEINNKVFDTIKPYNNDADALEFEEGLLSIR